MGSYNQQRCAGAGLDRQSEKRNYVWRLPACRAGAARCPLRACQLLELLILPGS